MARMKYPLGWTLLIWGLYRMCTCHDGLLPAHLHVVDLLIWNTHACRTEPTVLTINLPRSAPPAQSLEPGPWKSWESG